MSSIKKLTPKKIETALRNEISELGILSIPFVRLLKFYIGGKIGNVITIHFIMVSSYLKNPLI